MQQYDGILELIDGYFMAVQSRGEAVIILGQESPSRKLQRLSNSALISEESMENAREGLAIHARIIV